MNVNMASLKLIHKVQKFLKDLIKCMLKNKTDHSNDFSLEFHPKFFG